MDIGIVLATKDREVLLDKMLHSLMQATKGVSYELIVINGDSKDNTLAILRKYGIKNIYRESECMGAGYHEKRYPGYHSWSEIYNFGFKKTNAEWIMYCSDDVEFNTDCFANAMKVLKGQPESVAGGMFFYRTFPSDNLFNNYGIDYTYGHKLMVNYGLIRRDAFWEVGGLDTSYVFYCADGDLCFKLYEAGKTFVPLPKCLVSHYKGMDTSAKFHLSRSNQDIDNYKKKWDKFVKRAAGLTPRRVWLKDLERLERIKGGTQKEDGDSRRFIYMKEQIAYGTAPADAVIVKEIWL